MAFLTFQQVGELIGRLKTHFARSNVSKKKNKKERIFYILEPLKNLVHIIKGDDMLNQALDSLLKLNSKLEQFKNGSFFQELSVARNSTISITLNKNYKRIKNWGGSFALKFRSQFNSDTIVFDLVSLNSDTSEEIILPVLATGSKSENLKEFLNRTPLDVNIDKFINFVDIQLDPETLSRVKFELKEALKTVQMKLMPIESGVT